MEAAMNNSVNATTGKTPTEMVYGTPLRLFPSPRVLARPNVDIPAVSDYIQRIQDNIAFARDRHVEAKTKQTTYANKSRREEPDYKVGDKVYLETKNLRLRSRRKVGVLSFILAMSGRSKSRRRKRLPRITLSNYLRNIEFIPRFMLDD